jgi:glucose/arabinose dehydrogenase
VLREFTDSIRRVKTTASIFGKILSGSAAAAIALMFAAVATPATAADQPAVALQQLAESFVSPLNIVSLGDGSGRLLVNDQVGTIHVMQKDGKLDEKLFLDLRSKLTKLNSGFDERGLLGLALHPSFKSNRKLYAYYSAPRSSTAPTNFDHTSHLSEFTAAADFSSADLASERVLLTIDEPQFNHNGGRIAFGPDGYLYIGMGDGGGANDNEKGHAPQGNGQDTTTLLGKILRIDVNKGNPYAIPSDNPFADGKQGRPEIFAYGMRNPWGLSFDRGGDREFFVADVGQNLYEEINIVTKGGNYGWRVRESHVAFDPTKPNVPPTESPKTDAFGKPFIEPIAWYKHPARNKVDPTQIEGISITGGYVYRGKAIPALVGKYVFADWSRTWALPDGVLFTATGKGKDAKWTIDSLPFTSPTGEKIRAYIVAMGEDSDGELYVLTNGRNSLSGQTGKVFKLVAK